MTVDERRVAAEKTAGFPGDALPAVAVVMCAYTLGRWSDIKAGIEALRQQTLPPRDVILVVDHNDELAARAQRELTPRLASLRVVANARRRGLSGARNTGIVGTTAPLIAFLDDDALPEPSWLAELVAPFDEASVLITGGKATPVWPTSRPSWWPAEFDWVVGSSYQGMPSTDTDVRNVWGCSMAMRREVVDLAGLFNEGLGRLGRIPNGGEETELCIRLRHAEPAARVVYAPRSLVRHRVSPDRARWRYFSARCRAEGRSKALITAAVGTDATASERSYVLRTIPTGVAQALMAGARGDLFGPVRASVAVLGVLLTAYGFLLGRWGRPA